MYEHHFLPRSHRAGTCFHCHVLPELEASLPQEVQPNFGWSSQGFRRSIQGFGDLQIEECNRVTLTGILSILLNCRPKFRALSLVKCIGIKDICSTPAQLLVCKSLRSLNMFFGWMVLCSAPYCPRLRQRSHRRRDSKQKPSRSKDETNPRSTMRIS
ncbi:hypothetical protein ZWY2020_049715 [Hordeum vulgare]|nr:hypothetical protein ZWY2020_049715 [Hordeum vulgare]